MNRIIVYIIGVSMAILLFLIPVTVIGAIVENPMGFLGEVIFTDGDTTKVSKEVEEMYKEFFKKNIGKDIVNYINKKLEEKEKKYSETYFTIPMVLILNENDKLKDETFESLKLNQKIDILFDLRYEDNNDENYLKTLKENDNFKNISSLSNTTLMTYINYFSKNTEENIIVSGNSELGNSIAKSALSKQGCPYVWGAQGPDSFDCSGLVYWACKENGVNFTRTTAEVLSRMGKPVTREELQPGDIITFNTIPGEISHVGIYIGGGKMVHAPDFNIPVSISTVFGSPYWENIIYNCRRLY